MKTLLSVTLTVALALGLSVSAADQKSTGALDAKLELLGVGFHVTSPNAAAGNTVTIRPQGLTKVNRSETVPVTGIVLGAEVADLNVDQSPEIYVYVRDAEGKGSLVAYAANRKKSLSQIALPPLEEVKKNAVGYRGGDEFAVVEGSLVRRFPIYAADGQPSGKTRQLQYKLRGGEASWRLRLDKTVEF